jgi:hypothetical protein
MQSSPRVERTFTVIDGLNLEMVIKAAISWPKSTHSLGGGMEIEPGISSSGPVRSDAFLAFA